jgi:hypothetical protein
MTKISNTYKFSAAAAFGAAALFSMLSLGNSAQAATSLSSCVGNTAGRVVSCCEKLTEAQRPYWMIQSRTSCRKAAVCRGQGGLTIGIAAVAPKRCYLRVVEFAKEGGGEVGGGDSGRSPNNPR